MLSNPVCTNFESYLMVDVDMRINENAGMMHDVSNCVKNYV